MNDIRIRAAAEILFILRLDGCADLCHYSTCAGFMGTTMCLAAIKKIPHHTSAKVQLEFRFKPVPFLCLHSPTGPTT